MLNDNTVPSFDDVRRKVEEYETTIMALRAICKIITDHHKIDSPTVTCHSSYGRKMHTSSTNRIHPNNTATPDTVIQVGNDWGMVVEAKRTLPQNNNDRWHETVDQLRKYDDELLGWWTPNENIGLSNVALLVDVDRSIDFSMYIQSLIDGNQIEPFQNPTAVIEFFKKQEVKQFLHVRQVWGCIEPQKLSKKLESGKSISVEGLIDSQRFYDQEPEAVEYTMVLLWQTIFTERYLDAPYDEKSKTWIIEVDLDELTEYLQKLYGSKSNEPRERTFPRKKWIQKALEAFVLLNLASRSSGKNKYTIKFKKLRGGDIFQRFYKHREILKNKNAKNTPHQPELFSVENGNSDSFIDKTDYVLNQNDD
jgi:hypothetical protein